MIINPDQTWGIADIALAFPAPYQEAPIDPLPPATPTFSASTNQLDLYRVVFLAFGVLIAYVALRKR